MPALKIRVGVGVDANPMAAFMPIVAAARKARSQVEAELGNIGKKATSVYRTNAAAAEKSAAQSAAAAEKAAKQEVAAKERALAHVARIRDRYFAQQQRQEEQAAQKQAAAAQKQAERVGYWSTRYMARGFAAAGRFGMDIARGAGVNLDMGSIIGKAVSMEKIAANLSNASLGTGVAGNEKRVGVGALTGQAREIGIAAGFDPERILEGLSKFVGKTGDLKTGRDMLGDLAKLASASGSELEDVIDAAGDVANTLGDVPDKGKRVYDVMKAIAGQGKVGAVEIKDLAVQMAKLGAAAGSFEGDKGEAIKNMGVLAQLARATGGAASAPQAATSVARFVSTLQTPARLKAFYAAGMKEGDIYGKGGGLRDPFEIIKRAIAATDANQPKLHKLFASTIGNKPVDALSHVYTEAGKGKAGMEAVDKEIARLKNAAMSEAQVNEAHAARMDTSAAKVEQFNAKLSEIGAHVAERVLPQLDKLGPVVLSAVDGMGRLVAWASENPFKAVGALVAASIVGSISKAAIGDVAGKAIGNAISMLPKGSFGFAAATITIATATLAIHDYNEKTDQAKGDVNRTFDTTNDLLRKVGEQRRKGAVDKDVMDDLMRRGAEIKGLRGAAERYEQDDSTVGTIKHGIIKVVSTITGTSDELAKSEGTGKGAKQLDSALAIQAQAIDNLVAQMKAGKLQVNLTVNMQDGKPVVDQSNRTGP